MRARSVVFNMLLLAVDLAVAAAVAAGLAFMISPRLPWPVVCGLLWGAYLAFTIYVLLHGTSILLKEVKALPLNLALHPVVAKVLASSYDADSAGAPVVLRASSRSINALSLGRENGGFLVLTDGVLDGLAEEELRALIARESAWLRGGSAAIWLEYARLSIVPTLFGRMVGRRGLASVYPALSRAFFLGNLLLFAVFWLGMLVGADSSGVYRILLVLGMPSFTMVTILLTNLLASVTLLGLLRTCRLARAGTGGRSGGSGEAQRAGGPGLDLRRGRGTGAGNGHDAIRHERLGGSHQVAQGLFHQPGGLVPGAGMEPPADPRGEA